MSRPPYPDYDQGVMAFIAVIVAMIVWWAHQ